MATLVDQSAVQKVKKKKKLNKTGESVTQWAVHMANENDKQSVVFYLMWGHMILLPNLHFWNIFSECYNHFFKNKTFFHEDKSFKHIFNV